MGLYGAEMIRLRLAEAVDPSSSSSKVPTTTIRGFDESFHEQKYPLFMAEIRGIANGSGVDYDEILWLNLREEGRGCSDYTVPPAVGHNEDNRPSDWNRTFLAEVWIDGAFMVGYVYAGELPTGGFGWNTKIVATVDYVEPRDFLLRGGVGRNWVGRALLAAQSLEEALEIARVPHIAGHNYQIFNSTHFFVGEVARNLSVFFEAKGPVFKANEYDLLDIPQRIGPSTVHRTARALAQLGAPEDAKGILDVLWDERDVDGSGRYGIYCPTCTLCTALFDKKRVSIYVAKRLVYELGDWTRPTWFPAAAAANDSLLLVLLQEEGVVLRREEPHHWSQMAAVALVLVFFAAVVFFFVARAASMPGALRDYLFAASPTTRRAVVTLVPIREAPLEEEEEGEGVPN
ncbi:hypothetical protein CTAYLR_000102 [Chrysophaeum taylorii]|uniref:Peptidase C45 hydrolase domain-containing protein n=1 Tax=Chrysophaeum taylorii TaxID=2483200 RepID=A0AAD7UIJ8_9STRA|nr:hypothetical protein CTAYLR_000102 [Chrysophaeum taylorii]